ncbi:MULTISPECIES: hypothetical protein [unclassified Caballeronia]|uniref:hypothetical protein n=1 Tax=unclassified Caballeronia TaxID=2646786 RepID=UPI00285A0BFF|nr:MULTISPECIES: hypothetical protein [unclassified Caballeronia]MDR5753881.1 hypothetical protein [Caballeronia sp. LZ024]MDR5840260.1 hypothetical protein [Caballeronia sp. LZ031]
MHNTAFNIVAGAMISLSPTFLSIAFAAPSPAAAMPGAAISASAPTGGVEGVSVVETVGSIQAVNRTTREVMIGDRQGGRTKITVRPDAKYFAQLNAGDEVRVRMTRDVVVRFGRAAKGGAVVSAAVASMARSAPPVEVVADVVKVDPTSGVVQLKGPQGNLLNVQVHDRAKLAGVTPGTPVSLAYTEAVSVAVTPVH